MHAFYDRPDAMHVYAVIAAVEDWARWEHVPKGTLRRLEQAEAAIARVRELHHSKLDRHPQGDVQRCIACLDLWPCPTIRANQLKQSVAPRTAPRGNNDERTGEADMSNYDYDCWGDPTLGPQWYEAAQRFMQDYNRNVYTDWETFTVGGEA